MDETVNFDFDSDHADDPTVPVGRERAVSPRPELDRYWHSLPPEQRSGAEELIAEDTPECAGKVFLAGTAHLRRLISSAVAAVGGKAIDGDGLAPVEVAARIGECDAVLVLDDHSFEVGQACGMAVAMHKPLACLDRLDVPGAKKLSLMAMEATEDASAWGADVVTSADRSDAEMAAQGLSVSADWAEVLQAIVNAVECSPRTWRVDVHSVGLSSDDGDRLIADTAAEAACDAVFGDSDLPEVVFGGDSCRVAVWPDGEPEHRQIFRVTGSYTLEAEPEVQQ